MSRHRPYGDNASVTIQSVHRALEKRKRSPVEYESDLVLGSISGSFVCETAYERLISSVRVEYPRSKRSASKAVAHGKGRTIRKMVANTRHTVLTPEHLARTLNIGLDKAKTMLKVTTQKGIRTAVHPIHRRYRVDHLDLHSTRLKGKWYVDWMPAKTKGRQKS